MSGSKPFLNVKIEIPYDIMLIAKNEIMFEMASTGSKPAIPSQERASFIIKDKKPKTINSKKDAAQIVKMFLACFFIDENEGLRKPNASFVVAVVPTINPTSPMRSIMAGYAVKTVSRINARLFAAKRNVPVMLTRRDTRSIVPNASFNAPVNSVCRMLLGKTAKTNETLTSPNRIIAHLPVSPKK